MAEKAGSLLWYIRMAWGRISPNTTYSMAPLAKPRLSARPSAPISPIMKPSSAPMMVGTPEEVFGQKERLAEIGLSVPPVTELMHELKDAGIPVKENVLNLKDAEAEIYQYLQRKLLHD